VVLRGNRVLLVKRANAPSQGRWSVPGGVIELGETLYAAAAREIAEECAVEIEVERVINVLDNIIPDDDGRLRFHYVLIYVLARYRSGQVRPGSDALDARWLTLDELDELDMPSRGRNLVRQAFALAGSRESRG
jgi:ADP-ribose pyrophosphatase YjhB (NUDIX family)